MHSSRWNFRPIGTCTCIVWLPWLLFFTIYMIFTSTHSDLIFKLYYVSGFWISMCKTRAAPSTCLCSTRILNVYIMRQSKETLKGMSLSSYSMLEHLQEGKEFVFKLNLGNHKMCGLIRNYVVAFTFTSDFNLKKTRRKFCLYMETYLDG